MSDEIHIEEFISASRKEIAERLGHEAKDGDNEYCVLVYRTKPAMFGRPLFKDLEKVYSNLAVFERKVLKDIEDIDASFGIQFQCWIYD
jgi:hypothetical protein